VADSPSIIVKQAFEEWMNGSGNVSRIFAAQMKWEVFGRSAASGRYESAADFATKVLVPMNKRFVASDPMRPTKIRSVYADGPTVIVIWDGGGTTVLGTSYENTYAWIFTLDQGLVVEAKAFYDAISFDEMWAITPKEK
jgi:ketosteroid isomerase-like protein